MHPNGIEKLAREDRFGADRAIFLTDDTGPVHGPGQAAAAIDKGGADFYGSLIGILVDSLPLCEADGSNRSGGAKISAGNAIVLTPAGADSKIEQGCPQAFQAGCQPGRVDHVGRADAHALAAFYTAR